MALGLVQGTCPGPLFTADTAAVEQDQRGGPDGSSGDELRVEGLRLRFRIQGLGVRGCEMVGSVLLLALQ